MQPLGIRITLVTTGLLLENHAPDVAACIDTVVVSVGYSPEDYADAADEMLSELGRAPSARPA